MHYITEIKDIGKKCRIIIDDDIVVQLYEGDVRKLGIKADSQFSNESYNEMYNILNKRARERSLFLLKDMDKTEKQIRDKLKLGDYPEDIINNAIEFLKKYGYVDDIRYAKLYISSKQNSKSIKQIELELYKKGVNKENVSKVLLEMDLFMENASKALIIAGAIILSILIIALGMYIYQQASGAAQGTNLDPQKAQAYNSEFISYEGVRTGTDVRQLVGAIINHNRVNQDDTSRLILIEDAAGDATRDPDDANWTTNKVKDYSVASYKTGLTYKVSFGYNKSGYITVAYIVKQ